MNCPEHGNELQSKHTRYGRRWFCPVSDCTVACWDGSTSTPANDETRALRHRCHELFDPLWKPGRKQIFKKRWQAYAELRRVMGTSHAKTHIGCFNKEQCLTLIAHLLADDAPVQSPR